MTIFPCCIIHWGIVRVENVAYLESCYLETGKVLQPPFCLPTRTAELTSSAGPIDEHLRTAALDVGAGENGRSSGSTLHVCTLLYAQC